MSADTPPVDLDEDPPKLTEEQVREALRKSAAGANELRRTLEPVFRLHERSAGLVLR